MSEELFYDLHNTVEAYFEDYKEYLLKNGVLYKRAIWDVTGYFTNILKDWLTTPSLTVWWYGAIYCGDYEEIITTVDVEEFIEGDYKSTIWYSTDTIPRYRGFKTIKGEFVERYPQGPPRGELHKKG